MDCPRRHETGVAIGMESLVAFKLSMRSLSTSWFQMKSDDALWLVRMVTEQGLGDVFGILVVYVDDLALFAAPGLAGPSF